MIQAGLLSDSFGRVMRDLRVSITDRCNFRCLYCLPETEEAANFYRTKFDSLKNPHPTIPIAREWKPRSQILSYEEIERLVGLFVSLGIQKVRVTGGEPLLRQGVERLVAKLARIPGIEDLAMTSNGFLFLQKGEALRTAGLRRISFSMDSLTRQFQKDHRARWTSSSAGKHRAGEGARLAPRQGERGDHPGN
jgi:cyclic pyranopterin phosphate synthase